MQPVQSIGHALYRIVFRGGSPQRLKYSDRLLVVALLLFVALAIASQRYLFGSGLIPTGLFLFVALTGLYLATALLTRRVPRTRLRITLLAVVLLMAASQLLLLLAAPLARDLLAARVTVSLLAGIALLVGIYNCLRFALASGPSTAARYSALFALALTGFYATMYPLLKIVFS